MALAVGFLTLASAWAAEGLSPAQQRIELAHKLIEKNPNEPQGYNDLALALSQRARETSDTSFYDQGLKALEESFKISKDNFEGRKVQAWIFLGKHEFAKAQVAAKELNQQMPDDLMTYAMLTDANIELGNYKEAEEAAQWMLNLRSADVRGLTRGAYLRELFGNIDGAIAFFMESYQRTPPNESEGRAWILTQMAHLNLMKGQVETAEKILDEALLLFPGYHYALAQMAEVKEAQGKNGEAVDLLRQRFAKASHAENLYSLVVMLEKTGQNEEAKMLGQRFEQMALKEMLIWDNSNRELIFYYIEQKKDPAAALKVAQLESSRRHDIYTLDAYAWALHANGEDPPAYEQLKKALEVGIRDAKLFYHAGVIAAAAGDRNGSIKFFRQCVELNPSSGFSALAQKALAGS